MKLGCELKKDKTGCTFKVWAPYAQDVRVIGDFNNWNPDAVFSQMERDNQGVWSADIPEAEAEQKYKFHITGPEWNPVILDRPDPWARQMEHSAGASIIKDPDFFNWTDTEWTPPSFEEMVIYELHVSTFIGKNDGLSYPGDFQQLLTKLKYIKNLGANAIELLPVHEYAGDDYLGYAPVAFFPIEHSYGAAQGSYNDFKALVNAAHAAGLAVIADLVLNHFTDRRGDDKWIWNYDGDTKYGKGGIYCSGHGTPWGPAPDWQEPKVREYAEECCRYYLSELHVDGLRFDATQHITNKPGGWNALRNILWNLQQDTAYKKKIFIAENLPYEKGMVEYGNFDSAWWVEFHHSLEKALGGRQNSGSSVEEGINGGNYSALHKRIVYTLGHDETRNGSQYLISDFGGRDNWDARAKRRLMSALQFFIPGIPMIWQGEEFLQDGHFHDNYEQAVNWQYQTDPFGSQMQKMYQDASAVRNSFTALRYGDLIWVHARDTNRVLAFIRKDPVNGQILLVVVNLGGTNWAPNHSYGIQTGEIKGQWMQVFCSQDAGYGGRDGTGNAYYEPWTQEDGKIYINLPKWSVVVFLFKK
ncbi:1,4-alpha-glucan branching enzyme [Candidatus Electrothrix laxa]